jgi:hypothetical protein
MMYDSIESLSTGEVPYFLAMALPSVSYAPATLLPLLISAVRSVMNDPD